MMTEIEREKLREFNRTKDFKAHDLKRRWETTSKIKRPTLSHIHQTQRQATCHPSKRLQEQIEKFISLYPEYIPSYSVETIAANYIMVGVFFKLGYLKTPIGPYIIYLTWMKWKYQGILRNKPKLRKKMYKIQQDLGIWEMLLKEADKVVEKHGDSILPHYKG